MLEDRSYMRRPRFENYGSATLFLVILNVAAFLLQIGTMAFTSFPVDTYFALSTAGLKHGYLWQLLTFQLMHGGWLHLIVNCVVIFFWGRDVEQTLGRNSYLTLYFASGMIGGAFQVLAASLFPERFGGAVVGASAGGYGIIAAFAMLYPDRLLTLFPIPITIRVRYLLVIAALAAIFELLFSKNNVAHAAHLGGLLAGIGFVRFAIHWQWPVLRAARSRPVRPLVNVHSQKAAGWAQPKPEPEDLTPDEFVEREVNPILDKINAHGIQSLTDRERKILEAAHKKMGKR